MNQKGEWKAETDPNDPSTILLEGEVDHQNVSPLVDMLRSFTRPTARLDMSKLDIEDGLAMTAVINSLRELCSRRINVILLRPPQLLGHNLYRSGLLEEGCRIQMVDIRQEEPAEE